ncbi:MAG: hypothetical protein KC766_37050 [Myxococcales bacterium]|nr:hypothetical protein [Myxococcales bacterium]
MTLLTLVSACDPGLSPCAQTRPGADGEPRVQLWVDCEDEQAAQLVAVRVKPLHPPEDAGSDAPDADAPGPAVGSDAWRVQSPIEDGTDYFYVEYAVTPRGWDTLVAPYPLQSGERYEAEFIGSDIGSLSFEFDAP